MQGYSDHLPRSDRCSWRKSGGQDLHIATATIVRRVTLHPQRESSPAMASSLRYCGWPTAKASTMLSSTGASLHERHVLLGHRHRGGRSPDDPPPGLFLSPSVDRPGGCEFAPASPLRARPPAALPRSAPARPRTPVIGSRAANPTTRMIPACATPHGGSDEDMNPKMREAAASRDGDGGRASTVSLAKPSRRKAADRAHGSTRAAEEYGWEGGPADRPSARAPLS